MSLFHYIGQGLRDALVVVPLGAVRGLFLATFLVLIVWVISLPRSAGRPRGDSSWKEDLRLWAAVALLIQLAIYAVA